MFGLAGIGLHGSRIMVVGSVRVSPAILHQHIKG
jgi:hypothetical protein